MSFIIRSSSAIVLSLVISNLLAVSADAAPEMTQYPGSSVRSGAANSGSGGGVRDGAPGGPGGPMAGPEGGPCPAAGRPAR